MGGGGGLVDRSTGVTRGVFDVKGGVLKDTNGVSLTIPQGAISPKIRQEIYFAVTSPHNVDARYNNSKDLGRRASLSPPMHNGELNNNLKKKNNLLKVLIHLNSWKTICFVF